MNNFILELPELKNYYSQAELIKIWEDNQHVPFGFQDYCVESRIIKIDITKKLNHNIMTKEPEVWLAHKFAEQKLAGLNFLLIVFFILLNSSVQISVNTK